MTEQYLSRSKVEKYLIDMIDDPSVDSTALALFLIGEIAAGTFDPDYGPAV